MFHIFVSVRWIRIRSDIFAQKKATRMAHKKKVRLFSMPGGRGSGKGLGRVKTQKESKDPELVSCIGAVKCFFQNETMNIAFIWPKVVKVLNDLL